MRVAPSLPGQLNNKPPPRGWGVGGFQPGALCVRNGRCDSSPPTSPASSWCSPRCGMTSGAGSSRCTRSRSSPRGLQAAFTQDNHSRSVRGVLRGMHFQHPHGQVKLVRVVRGEVFDAVVDVRRVAHLRARHLGRPLRGEPPPAMGAGRLRPRLLRPQRNGGLRLQVQRRLLPGGRAGGPLGRSGVRDPLAGARPPASRPGTRRCPSWRRPTSPCRSMASRSRRR